MENDECKAKPTRVKIIDVKIGLSETFNLMMELRENWIINQKYENSSEVQRIRLSLEQISLEYEKLAQMSSHSNHRQTII